MTRFIISILILPAFIPAFSQDRYLEEITDSVLVETFTYAQKDGEELMLDVYTPAFDSNFERPVLLYVHGGGFFTGTRDNKNAVEFCKRSAMHGYVAVSASYRLLRKDTETRFGCDCPLVDKLKTIRAAVEDIQDATFFLIQQREMLGINPHKIILAGSSAGGLTVLATGFQPPNCYGLDSGPVAYAGIISMAGTMANLDQIYDDSAVPALLFHGTCDNIAPYQTAPDLFCKEGSPGYLILNGAYAIAEKLRVLGKPYWLHTSCGENHSMAVKPIWNYFDVIMEFSYRFCLNNSKEQIHTIIQGEHSCDLPGYNFCEN